MKNVTRLEAGTIVRLADSDRRGIVLECQEDESDVMIHLFHYDFSTSWVTLDCVEVIRHSDAIYKVMYEMNGA